MCSSDLKAKHQQLLDNLHFEEDLSSWEDGFFEAIEFLKGFKIVNGEYFLNERLQQGQQILAEGAQGSMLDVDFGTFPYVTSSNTISAGVCTGLGVSPKKIREVIGVTKAYCTRVGGGPFPTELNDATGELIRKIGSEFGATTGRPRRCGWIDLVALHYACMINGVTQLVMTKTDVLDTFSELQVCTDYLIEGKPTRQVPFQLLHSPITPQWKTFLGWKTAIESFRKGAQLPAEMNHYIAFINQYLGVQIRYISNGPAREQLIEIE